MILPPARFFAQPPTQAELDFTNPILKKIEHVISGNAAFLTKGKYNTSLRTGTIAPALVRRPSGLSYALGTGAAGVNWVATDAGEWVNSQTAWTYFTLSFWRGGSANRSIATIAEVPGSATRDRSLVASSAAGGFFQVATRDGATDVIVSSTTTLTTIGANPVTLAGRATTSELAIFVNGVKEASAAITSTGRTYTSPELVLAQGGLGTGISNTQQSQSDPSIFLVWSRALSDEEIASLHRNPWQVFRAASRIIVPESAAVTAYTLDTTPGTYNITGAAVSLLKSGELAAGGGPGKTSKRGWANERAKFEQSLRTEEVAEQVKAAQRVLKKAQSESAQRLGELVAEYEAARASLDELREQVARIERESRIREEVEVASKVVEIFAREEEEIIAILEIIDEMDSRALLAAVGIAA